jgi:hypothetical protein
MPVLLYGAELWGGSQTHVRPLQSTANKGMRLLIGCSMRSTLPAMLAVQRELHCAPVHAAAVSRKWRAYNKWASSRTWIHRLIAGTALGQYRAGSWVLSAKSLCTKWSRLIAQSNDDSGGLDDDGNVEAPDHWVEDVRRVQDAVWKHAESVEEVAKSARVYIDHEFARTALSRSSFYWDPRRGKDLATLVRARVGAYVTAVRLRHGMGEEGGNAGICSYCTVGVCEDMAHVLLDCSAWSALRRQMLDRLITEACTLLDVDEDLAPASRSPDLKKQLVWMLLGGVANGVALPAWSSDREKNSDVCDHFAEDDFSEHSWSSDELRQQERAECDPARLRSMDGCFSVARYLANVAIERRRIDCQ